MKVFSPRFKGLSTHRNTTKPPKKSDVILEFLWLQVPNRNPCQTSAKGRWGGIYRFTH